MQEQKGQLVLVPEGCLKGVAQMLDLEAINMLV